ncbi:MAG: hypothetical protein N3F08_02530 [Crenarchaeota archaeon]|nr:hypothetical protein [Thermoproteota archaeon]
MPHRFPIVTLKGPISINAENDRLSDGLKVFKTRSNDPVNIIEY